MFLLSEAQVRRCLLVHQCIAANRIALGSLRHKIRRRRRPQEEGVKITNCVYDNGDGSSEGGSALKTTNINTTSIVPTRIGIPYYNTHMYSSTHKHNIKKDENAKDMTLFKPAGYFPQPNNSKENEDGNHNNDSTMGLKVVSVRANNPSIGKPLVPASVVLLDAETGEVSSVVAATYLTAARTAAGSAIATELCLNRLLEMNNNNDDDDDVIYCENVVSSGSCNDHNEDPSSQKQKQQSRSSLSSFADIHNNLQDLHLVVIGAGLQAELHIQYLYHIPVVRNRLKKVSIINRTIEKAETLVETIQEIFISSGSCSSSSSKQERVSIEFDCITYKDQNKVKDIINTANVIVACTNTTTPLFDWENWVPPYCHINGVGSYQSDCEEVCSQFIKDRCSVIIDTIEALDVGDLKGLDKYDDQQFVGLLGDVLSGDVSLPRVHLDNNRRSCTFYKSVGTAIQDIITAEQVVKNAKHKGIGTSIDMA